MRYLFLCALLLSSSILAQEVPGVSAKSYVVLDEAGSIVLQKDASTPRPIASISKLLVAEQIIPELNRDDKISVRQEDLASRWTRIKSNTILTQEQLLELALIPSNNQAIYALARAHNTDKIIDEVNRTAQARGLTTITIEEPSGLSENNRASAIDLAKFSEIVVGSRIAEISTTPTTSYGGYRSTNPYIGKQGWKFYLSKTGFINAAGGCLTTILDVGDRKLTVVILGSNNTITRWTDLAKIRTYISATDSFWALQQGKPHEHHRNRIRRKKSFRPT